MGSRGQGYELNIFEKEGKGRHFGGARNPLPLLLGNVSQPICGPIVFIRDLFIFSFSVGFSEDQRQLELVPDPWGKSCELNIFENGRKGGHFAGSRRPFHLLLGNVL